MVGMSTSSVIRFARSVGMPSSTRVGPCFGDGFRVGENALRGLHPKATHGVHALGRETHVRHDRDAGVHDALDRRRRIDPPFELDGLRSALGEEPASIRERLLRAHLPAEERHVPDDVGAPRASDDGATVVNHLVDRDGQGGVLPLHDHPERVPHEENVHARIVE